MTRTATADHGITPLLGSSRCVSDGHLADLLDPRDYPVEAVCLDCGQPVRCERYFAAGPAGGWVHLSAFTLGGV